jgi:plasmid stabilization system protein ParE
VGPQVADQYIDYIEAALDRLRENPEILFAEPNFAPAQYFYRVRKHILVCNCAADLIIVLTVIHTSMDIASRLSELEPEFATEVYNLQARLKRD